MPKILVVDDDVHFQVIMRKMLEGEGYEVAIAPDGNTALEMLRGDQPPDLILLDVMMATTLEGIDVAREIKADPALENLPIIMVSSISTSPYASDFPDDEHIPIDGWITKPVQRNVLLKILDHFVAEGSKDES
jgi:CheY-like chemotaxis protein